MPEFLQNNKPVLIAHRGYSSIAPENTISSISSAINNGFKMIEIDVQLSKDGELMVIHDFNINRVSDGRGKVNKYNVGELKKYDVGKWFNPKYRGDNIPTLEEVFILCKGRILIDIEIKIPLYFKCHHLLIKKLTDLIEKYEMHNSVIISSFDKNILKYFSLDNANIPLAFLADNFFTLMASFRLLKKYKLFGLILNHKIINWNIIKRVHNSGMFIFVYTVNNYGRAIQLKEMGVDGIISNNRYEDLL
jgi:glycerophosphoryl diester phosphodiesterase